MLLFDRKRNSSLAAAPESLEARTLMSAGPTAGLNAGVLSINGSGGADTITVRERANQFTVNGVNGQFAANLVKSIAIDCKGGNETIYLGNQGASGEQTIKLAISIHAGAGNETVYGPDGRAVFFSGVGHTLTYDALGAARLDGATPTWFDMNLYDAAIRGLAKQDFADHVIDRGDMLGIFRQVERAGAVTSTELADLQTLDANGSLFGYSDDVRVLAGDVVSGNAANAHFLGQSLGNLHAGSSATQLESLVQKWFLGADHPQTDAGLTYQAAAGTLFAHAPVYSDVRQGQVGDCYFVATLGEAALRSPATITGMFIVNGDGTYEVRFYHNGKDEYVTVDSKLPTDMYGRLHYANFLQSAGDKTQTLWVALAEKAYVQMNESGWLRTGFGITLAGGGQNAYSAISGGYGFMVMSQITLNHVNPANMTSDPNDFNLLVAAWNSGSMIDAASKGSPATQGIVGGHMYAVVGVDAKSWTITVYNPWGLNNVSNKPGLVTLSWTDFKANFQYWDEATTHSDTTTYRS